MSIVREFNSVSELLKYLDDEITESRRRLGEVLKRLEELRIKAEQEKKLRSVLGKLGIPEAPSSNEVNLRNAKIIVNPAPSQEIAVLESSLESLNNRITLLTAIRKELEILSGVDIEIKITAVYIDGVPRVFLLKFS